jgi:hypothetical protein
VAFIDTSATASLSAQNWTGRPILQAETLSSMRIDATLDRFRGSYTFFL